MWLIQSINWLSLVIADKCLYFYFIDNFKHVCFLTSILHAFQKFLSHLIYFDHQTISNFFNEDWEWLTPKSVYSMLYGKETNLEYCLKDCCISAKRTYLIPSASRSASLCFHKDIELSYKKIHTREQCV